MDEGGEKHREEEEKAEKGGRCHENSLYVFDRWFAGRVGKHIVAVWYLYSVACGFEMEKWEDVFGRRN